jgi:cobalt-zinc-cadmium efflux system protein
VSHAHVHHGADHRPESHKRLVLTLVITAAFTVVEAIGGHVTGSLALLADAGHMLSDVAAIALSIAALWIARRPPTTRRTFGYYRMEILAALINGSTLVAITIFIFVEAFQRFRAPPVVAGPGAVAVAAAGLLVNVVALTVLAPSRKESLNVHGAWLHVLTDAMGSVAAIVSGALIWAYGWQLADPIASVLIGLLLIHSAWSLLSETVNVLLESAPSHIDPDQVRETVRAIPGVLALHDLHVWTITSGLDSLSAHVVMSPTASGDELLQRIHAALHERFGLDHITIQLETEAFVEAPTHR